MNYLGLLGVGVETARDTVAEAHTDGNDYVGLLSHDVGRIAAVHTEHSHVEGMVGGKGRESEQGAGCGDVGFLKEFKKLVLCSAKLHAMTHESERTLCLVDKLGSSSHMVVLNLGIRLVAAHGCNLGRLPLALVYLGTLGEVEHHWTRTARTGDVEGTAHSPGNVLGAANLIAPLADRLGKTYEVDLLEGVGAKRANAHLSGNDYDRCGVDHGVGNTCKGVGNARTACHQAHAHLAANA